MRANEALYCMEAQERLISKLVSTFRNYWEENCETILAGLGTLNGGVPYRSFYNN